MDESGIKSIYPLKDKAKEWCSANTATPQLRSCSASVAQHPWLKDQGQVCSTSLPLTAIVLHPKKNKLGGLGLVDVKAWWLLKMWVHAGGPVSCGAFIPLGCKEMGPKMTVRLWVCKLVRSGPKWLERAIRTSDYIATYHWLIRDTSTS